jgi:KDO2-lipid IV(A) lauroyltransferase
VDKKKINRFLRYWAGLIVMNLGRFLAGIMPLRGLYFISPFIARVGFVFSKRHRRIAEEGLAIAFGPHLDVRQRRQVAVGSFTEMVKGALETVVFLSNPAPIRKRITVIGSEHLKLAISRGKGAICVSAHFGNFILMAAHLRFCGFPMAVVIRPMRDNNMDQFFTKKRREFGIESIYSKPPKVCVDQSLAVLRKNGVLFNLLDQNFGADSGVFVDFFGTQAATATGPIVLALRSKAAVVPVFIIRKEDNTQEIIIEPEFQIEKKENFDQTIHHNISRLTKIIENYIRKYPTHWSWIHRRWKSRPPSDTD